MKHLNEENIEFLKNLSKTLNIQDIEFLKNLSKTLNIQDNRSTADPVGFLIQYDHYVNVPYDIWGGDRKEYYHEGEVFENRKYLEEHLKEGELNLSEEELEDMIDEGVRYMNPINAFEPNFFLTSDACKEYIEGNRHSLRGNPRSYGIPLFRNPEMEQLVKILKKIGDENLKCLS